MDDQIEKTDQQWRDQLDEIQYEVTRRKGTEPAFTGKYWNHDGDGTYQCVCCGASLFDSSSKFDSGCGWPSFDAPSANECIKEELDSSHGLRRTEVICTRCGAHLGHVFNDGPPTTGLRYCINSASLDFDQRPDGQDA